jgi:hypothetical protein
VRCGEERRAVGITGLGLFTVGHPYVVGGAAGPVPGPPQGERCASPSPTVVYHSSVGKGLSQLGGDLSQNSPKSICCDFTVR